MAQLHDPTWQMSAAEQAAVEGLLARLRPGLAIEVGTAEGAGARKLAARAGEVHCFDLTPPTLELPENVVVHSGDSHRLLPAVLAELAEQGRNVDFAIVDGDHSPSGVRRDVEDLLDSPALGEAAILVHDTANERVRSGLDAIRFAAWPKVVHVHLDWIPGQLFREEGLSNQLWYGLGLILLDASRPAYGEAEVIEQRYFPAAPLLVEGREALAGDTARLGLRRTGEPAPLQDLRWELDRARDLIDAQQEELEGMRASQSWRLTAPLRRARHRLGGARGR